jgi:radical S-adenosyl methionine domain-containing protein 2
MIDYISSKGIGCSIITNGSLLTTDFIARNRGKLQMIGISVDALDYSGNKQIGRLDHQGRELSKERLVALAKAIHAAEIKLKINTVVNAVNCGSDFSSLIRALAPERWKLLRMLHYEHANDIGRNLMISDEEFQTFVNRHLHLHPVVEDSADMVDSYIVVNPQGRILVNSSERFQATESLVNHPFLEEFAKVAFNETAYQKRYKVDNIAISA